MFQSMQKIKALPPETVIYCGHEYTASNIEFAKKVFPDSMAIFNHANELAGKKCTVPTTLATELATNPFLIAETLTGFSNFRNLKDKIWL